MKRPLLLSTLLLLHCTPALAIDTTTTPGERLIELGVLLEARSGPSQWQQLWQRVRANGLFLDPPAPLHFSVKPAQVAAMARQVLIAADEVRPFAVSYARYRRGFATQIVGQRGGQALHALCLDIDWRALPTNASDQPEPYLRLVTLANAYPCE